MKKVLLCASLALATMNVQAMQVTPLGQTISPDKSNGSLTITNTSGEKKEYQLNAQKWTLNDGKQVKIANDEIRFAPSAFYLEPGKSQTVRFINSAKSADELAYRVTVKESNFVQLQKTGINPIFNMNFPIFWRSSNKASLIANGSGNLVTVRNTGKTTAQLAKLNYGSIKHFGLFGYLLPGEVLTLPKNNSAKISALVNGIQTNIAVE